VLPELGADKVIQTTFIDYIFDLIGHKYKLSNSDEKLISIITRISAIDNDIINLEKAAAFKGSMGFKNIIDKYIDDIELTFVPDEDFALGDYVILDKQVIRNIFLKDYNHLPL
jgi:DNA helicase-2/ATP-dependent DNA helicase PcrA